MSGTALKIDYNDNDLQGMLRAMIDRTRDFTKLMEAWGSIGRTSVIENFEDGGRPERWTPAKDGGRTLFRQGMAGGLAGSVNYQAAKDHVILGTNKIYAAIHQFGGKTKPHVIRPVKAKALKTPYGFFKKVNHPGSEIPARPFLVVQAEDITEMQETLKDYVLGM